MVHRETALDADVTQLLGQWSEGDRAARDRLLPVVYDELRTLARHHLRGGSPADTLHTTALVHEAYLRLAGLDRTTFQGRAYFFAVASRAMRRIVLDHARARSRERRGGGLRALSLDADDMTGSPTGGVLAVAETRADDLVALDEALSRLAAVDERMGRIVEYRFFGGLTAEEIGTVLDMSAAEVYREWAVARAWLGRALLEP